MTEEFTHGALLLLWLLGVPNSNLVLIYAFGGYIARTLAR